ncbi:MAG: FtsW/RodA/SpoVE family cell cycle protein [Bacteroidales bacterium]|nr:FtsW/RodA/SpoVE family cell cycle protein [Bacteroidales bacterium]
MGSSDKLKLKSSILHNVGDKTLWVVVLILSAFSLVFVYSSVGYTAVATLHTTPEWMFFKHLMFVSIAYLLAFFISFRGDYRKWGILYKPVLVGTVVLLVWALAKGTRWIGWGIATFQPSEIAKIALVFSLAYVALAYEDKYSPKELFWRMIAMVLLIAGLIIFENGSTAAIIFAAGYFVILYSGINKKHATYGLAIGLAVGLLAVIFLVLVGDEIDFGRTTTWHNRIQTWLHPNPDELTQENMARMAVARGGWLGCGIGSTIHGRLMTQAHNDFIYAIIIEELGFVWAMFIFLLYSIFFYRCIRIAIKCRNSYGQLLVAGLGTIYFIQALVHMLVSTGVLPVTGQPLPFISYGGSSYLMLGVAVGIIQCVARKNNGDEKRVRVDRQQSAQAEGQPEAEAIITNQNDTK